MRFLYNIFYKRLYLTYEFFIVLLGIAVLFVFGFIIPAFFLIAQACLALFLAITLLEFVILQFVKKPIAGTRDVMNPLSVGDDNRVTIRIKNRYNFKVRIIVYDNPPYQLQLRDLKFKATLASGDSKQFEYFIHPTDRGEYHFGDVYVYCSTLLHLVQRKAVVKKTQKIPAYPSIIQMKKYELKVFAKTAVTGIKKIRRLGHNNEFEQIKNYVQGDDIRTVNWKATSRMNSLMVNQYQDEREQQVYAIIDKSRSMRMPFNDLTLLDYAINSTLAFSNVCMRKGDKAGLITFSDKLGTKLAADRSKNQLSRIMEALYHQRTRFLEANFEMLYHGIRNHIKGRSLIMLYTNIESEYSLKRILPLLRRINQLHVLVVIFFENTEVSKTAQIEPKHVRDIYLKTFAEKYAMDKKKVALELRKNGIQTVLTTPEDLTIDSINKYLELKARGVI
ncbi:DUF58 domain-containing protein [Paracrocinitomix mangrovi]|uniref:DUF58 domain-containing protein n=1 Tax=Paracrocinitomix mangrovi TaxID=2862509 RepID=UPI001C8CF758|nr:DUF58 domain-containing protein [Paracrocinitomix mangrovi]UKN00432.1 DUF58 domain-containing protein [Paracrocinitomix mangrovi]